MIEVKAVQPIGRENRPIKQGWGLVHWVCLIPAFAVLLGFAAFGMVASAEDDWNAFSNLYAAFLIGSWLIWVLGGIWYRRVVADETRRAPTGPLVWDWTIDVVGMRFENGLQSNAVDWRGVKTVREENDRFVFLVTPAYNFVLPKRLMNDRQLVQLTELITSLRSSGRLGSGVDSPPLPSDNLRS